MNLTLRITRRASDRLRAGHLWVYRSDVEAEHEIGIPPGALVTIVDNREIPLGTALYSSSSQIAARLISHTAKLERAEYLIELRERVASALALRRELAPLSAENNAHRLIFAEADNLPGIIADRYNDLVMLQLLTQGTAQDDVRDILVQALREHLKADDSLTIWERPDPRIRELEQLPAPAPGPLFTTAQPEQTPTTTTTFILNRLRFQYDASAGQKTGAFLDQRLNYAAAAQHVLASGRKSRTSGRGLRALDVCTYQGGFALHLAQVCSRVTGIDQSRAALEAAERNLTLNPHISSRCEVDWVEADAFALLRALDDAARNSAALGSLPIEAGAFDAIVLDPPAFAKSKRAAEAALRGYKELNLRAVRLLAPGGTLITCSCSHHVSLADFTEAVAAAAADAKRRVQLLEIRAAAPDHPEVLTLPETRYLKCLICRVD
ncbi:MAG TPA: class I SAM-dependent rRNA methyltransferase [Candidatus Aquilonibacter sp.]|nr:class I SAM-dependent rRNA methyltransferase [Candidatus Aquilonibacter sp.]